MRMRIRPKTFACRYSKQYRVDLSLFVFLLIRLTLKAIILETLALQNTSLLFYLEASE